MSDESLVRYLLDQLDDEEVSARRMFGGHGIYRDGRMFALVYGGKTYMKVTKAEEETSDRPSFSPPSGQTFRSFREVYADELEDREALNRLAAAAVAAARSAVDRRS